MCLTDLPYLSVFIGDKREQSNLDLFKSSHHGRASAYTQSVENSKIPRLNYALHLASPRPDL